MSARGKARKLVRLATDKGTPDNEAMAAAMTACRIINENDLLDDEGEGGIGSIISGAGLDEDQVEAATSIFKKLSDPEFVSSVKKIARSLMRGRRR